MGIDRDRDHDPDEWEVDALMAEAVAEEEKEDDDHEYHGDGDGCPTCEDMGLCPTCGSASPWRCGCQTDEDEDDVDIIGCTKCGEKKPCDTVILGTETSEPEMLCFECANARFGEER